MARYRRAGRHVEADGRLVEQTQLRAVQNAAGHPDQAAMAAVGARARAHPAAPPSRAFSARSMRSSASLRVSPRS